MQQVCFLATAKLPASRGDVLFPSGSTCKKMYFLAAGSLFYQRPAKVKTLSDIPVPRVVTVEKGQWFTEAALWVDWVNRGSMIALIESDVITIDATKFCQVSSSHCDVFEMTTKRGREFIKELNDTLTLHGHVWDLQPEVMYSAQISKARHL